VLVAVSARSIASVADEGIDITQFRALVIVASRRAVSLGELATSAGLNLSTASRMCDRLVGMNLLHRAEDPANRRQLVLTSTDQGRRIVSRVTRRRRTAIEPMLRKLPKARRALLVDLLEELAVAGGVPAEHDLWAMGWTS
jgi:DNA-binding MarR family transcriptional regulator